MGWGRGINGCERGRRGCFVVLSKRDWTEENFSERVLSLEKKLTLDRKPSGE